MPKHTNIVSRGILKAMGLFGGTQVMSILCAIIRTKLIAIWMGPTGVGLFGLYNSAVDMVNSVSNMGIRSSSVRDISKANASGDREKMARIVKVVRRWSWTLGVAWAFLMLIGAPMLSYFTFGDYDHVWGFMALSVCVITFSIMNCEQAVMQGSQKLKHLAKSMVWGVATGLVVTVPMNYYWRLDSVVPSIMVYAVSCCMFTWLFRNRDYDKDKVELSARETIKEGAEFVKLGICITVSSFVALLVSYVFAAYLNHRAGTVEVGLYQAGNALINRYAALLFSSIGLEYYPRLARVCNDRMRLRVFVSQETNMTLYILVPVIVLFLLFRELIVSLLYSPEFHKMLPFISWCMIGMVMKGVSWCISFVILAKGDSKIYLVTESASAALCLILNVTFYEMWGLGGLGISYAVWYMLYLVMVAVVYYKIYGLSLHRSVLVHALYALAVSSAALWAMSYNNYLVTILLALATGTFSIIKIRKSVA